MARIEIYTKQWCPYCLKAKALLRAKGIAYDEIDVTADEPRQAGDDRALGHAQRAADLPRRRARSAATTTSPG